MTVTDLQNLFEYSYWANRHLFDVLTQLTDEEFVRPVAGSYGSVRNTMVHTVSAEWGWLDRCGGRPRGPSLKSDDYPTVASVRERWQEVEGHVRSFLSALRDDDLDRKVEWALGSGPAHTSTLSDLLQHVIVHGIHHRGQVALLLRLLGHAPGNFDALFYQLRASSEQAS